MLAGITYVMRDLAILMPVAPHTTPRPMPCERLESYTVGTRYSVAHYYTQNGDAMRDPEMYFMHTATGAWVPMYFLQDNLGVEEESVRYDDMQDRWYIRRAMQADHARFAIVWMKNIKEQQGLKV
jgi:hypothetical protein